MLTRLSADDLGRILIRVRVFYAHILFIKLQRMIWWFQRVAHVIDLLMLMLILIF